MTSPKEKKDGSLLHEDQEDDLMARDAYDKVFAFYQRIPNHQQRYRSLEKDKNLDRFSMYYDRKQQAA